MVYLKLGLNGASYRLMVLCLEWTVNQTMNLLSLSALCSEDESRDIFTEQRHYQVIMM